MNGSRKILGRLGVQSATVLIVAVALTGVVNAAVVGPIVAEPVSALAAGAGTVVAMVAGARGREVVVLQRGGEWPTVVSRWPDAAARTRSTERPEHAHAADLDDVLSLYEMTDADRDAPELEDLMDVEGVDEAPRRRRTAPGNTTLPLSPRALAAGPDAIWMATMGGVWRLSTRPPDRRWQPRGLPARELSLIAAGLDRQGRAVVAVAGPQGIWRSDDDGESWRLLAGTTGGPPRALAVPPDGGDILVADDEGLWAVVAHQPARRLLDGAITDATVCHGRIVILGRDGLYGLRSSSDVPQKMGPAPAARAIRCASDGAGPWIATGSHPLISFDDGQRWEPLGDVFPDVGAAAVIDDQLWIGTPEGLFAGMIASAPAAPGRLPERATVLGHDSETDRLLSLPVPDPRPWMRLLPLLSVLGSVDIASTGRRNVRALMVLTVPLSRARPAGTTRLASEILRRRAAAAGQRRRAELLPVAPEEMSP